MVKKINSHLRQVLLKPILKLRLYIPEVSLQTTLTHSSTMKTTYEDVFIKDHMKTKDEAMMEV